MKKLIGGDLMALAISIGLIAPAHPMSTRYRHQASPHHEGEIT